METFFQGLIVVFREGLEAFLIVAILLKFLDSTNNNSLKKHVWNGTGLGILASLIFGGILFMLSQYIGTLDVTAKLWESIASFIALVLITTFIIFMIKHGSEIKHHITNKAALNLTTKGIILITFFMVAREGAEIAIFSFAGQYSLLAILAGLALATLVVTLIHYSIVKVPLKTIFGITMVYLILQAGFLLGYSIHEGLEALEELALIPESHPLMTKAFDLSSTVLYHKEGIIGIPLYVLTGWYSKPEWIQFIAQYVYIALLFLFWYKDSKKTK